MYHITRNRRIILQIPVEDNIDNGYINDDDIDVIDYDCYAIFIQ